MAAEQVLPMWQEDMEFPEHAKFILNYHCMQCTDFTSGLCKRPSLGNRGKTDCFGYHYENQRRRTPVDPETGRLRYWDVPCDFVSTPHQCPHGENCTFAHSREEVNYHAAKYKTKLCNEKECRGKEVCCFAHGKNELRAFAMSGYSYWSTVAAPPSNQGPRRSARTVPPPSPHSPIAESPKHYGVMSPIYHAKVYKNRFCASYPNTEVCRRGEECAYAHCREEIRNPLLSVDEEEQSKGALTDDFFMYRFKTFWCPVGVPHDWQNCAYAHNYQDARRNPKIGYGPKPCPHWQRKETTLEYEQRCPKGIRCPYSHGAKEQLYHPSYFKTVVCQDWQKNACPRGHLCAFWHSKSEQRNLFQKPDFKFEAALSESMVQEHLQPNYIVDSFSSQQDLGQADHFFGAGMMIPMGAWTPTICRAQTSTTPTTAAESDAASAGSGEKEDSGQASPMSHTGSMCFALPSPLLGPQVAWQAGALPWQSGGMATAWPGMMSPMMCFVQAPMMCGPNGAGAFCQAMPMAATWTAPEVPALALPSAPKESTSDDLSGVRTPECGYESWDEDDAPLPTYNGIFHFKNCSDMTGQQLPLAM